MALPLITAITEDYLPGLKALAKSFYANAGDRCDLVCLHNDNHTLSYQIADCHADPVTFFDCWTYPVSRRWPVECPEMYVRLDIPKMFGYVERVIWIDADCIILDKLDELAELEFDEPIAAVDPGTHNYTVGFHIPEIESKVRVPFSGLIVFNIPKWNELGLTEKCREIMQRTDLTFEFAVQSVLGLALEGNFHELDPKWQAFANRKRIPEDAKILHWVGGLPWRDEMNNSEIWQQYA